MGLLTSVATAKIAVGGSRRLMKIVVVSHSTTSHRPVQPRMEPLPDFLFGTLESWFDRVPVVRSNGKESYDERILEPASRFFTEALLVDLAGAAKSVLDLRR